MDLINYVKLPSYFREYPNDLSLVKHPFTYLIDGTKWRDLVLVCFRGFGKTVFAAQLAFYMAINGPPKCEIIYCSKAKDQAKRNFGNKIKSLIEDKLSPGSYTIREYTGEFFIRKSRGDERRIYILSYETEESLRGLHPYLIILDECSDASEYVVDNVIMGMRQGNTKVLAMGTVKGENSFYRLYQQALEEDSGWDVLNIHADLPNIMDPELKLRQIKKMRPENWRQEYMNDFNAYTLLHAVYEDTISRFAINRMNENIVYDPSFPLYTAWDMGYTAYNSIWFFQKKYDRICFVDFMEGDKKFIPDIVADLNLKPYKYHTHFLPFDGAQQNIRGLPICDQLYNLGHNSYTFKSPFSDAAGIRSANNVLKQCWMNSKTCSIGIDHLHKATYHIDRSKSVNDQKIENNQHGHASDAFNIASVALQSVLQNIAVEKILDSETFYETQYFNIENNW